MTQLTTFLLDTFVDKRIDEICPLGFGTKGDIHNHCAHFVSHVLRLNCSGTTCALMTYLTDKNPAAGGLIRVNEIFNSCSAITEPDPRGCLAYYTLPSNLFKDGTMGSARDKHVGICIDGFVYNYGNRLDKVRKNNVGDLAKIYGKNTVTLYTALPLTAIPMTLDEIQALAIRE